MGPEQAADKQGVNMKQELIEVNISYEDWKLDRFLLHLTGLFLYKLSRRHKLHCSDNIIKVKTSLDWNNGRKRTTLSVQQVEPAGRSVPWHMLVRVEPVIREQV